MNIFLHIVLYSSNQIVLFYDSNTWSYTKLGHINLSKSELTDLLGDEDVVITIPAPEKGLGISSMMASEEEGLYVLTVNYSDGTSERLVFNKPAEPNKWFSGASVPSFDLGSNGDYYFDHAHKVIYTKENGVWVSVVSFEDDNNYYNKHI